MEIAVGRVADEREPEFSIVRSMSGMLRKTGRGSFLNVELAIQIGRKDGMDGAAVNVIGLSMTVIGVRMDVKQRNREYPDDDPDSHRSGRP